MEFKLLSQVKDKNGNPQFKYQVRIEGVACSAGSGYSKKESQQAASKDTLQRLRCEPQLIDSVFAAKGNRTKMEEEPVSVAPAVTETEGVAVAELVTMQPNSDRKPQGERRAKTVKTSPNASQESQTDEFDLSDITTEPKEQSVEDIIAAAESEAFGDA